MRDQWQDFVLRAVGAGVALEIQGKEIVRADPVTDRTAGGLQIYLDSKDTTAGSVFKDLWLRELGPDGKPPPAEPRR